MLATFRNLLDRLILFVSSFALMLLVVTVTWQVFSRYVLNDPSNWTDELARYAMVWLGLLGASYLFGIKGHLAITLLDGYLKGKAHITLHLLINVISGAFVFLAMLQGGIALMGRTTQQLSPALQLPMSTVYSILPISAVIILIYLVMNTFDLFCEPNKK
ncbi:TRAP transporter small permease [Vibrio coralliirubri]|uniref:TRAP transporter small permease n=1 Tax=Vibrio coralliirubri TaxID=1516159 RepID=UPI000635C6F0|nr:TRAP transporter small permease [Vibrio coralliirubri]CDU15399.1 C4-dicarboxylate transport system (Permease small protein) [Vibrio coralliirubri]